MALIKANYRPTFHTFVAGDVTGTATGGIRILNHGLRTGDVVGVIPDATGLVDTALVTGTPYFIIVIDGSNIRLASSYANAFAGTNITLNANQTGVDSRLYVGGSGRVLLQPFPINAVIENVTYDVVTTFISRTEAAGYDGAAGDLSAIGIELVTISGARVVAQSLSLMDETAAASTISDAANAWDAGVVPTDAIISPDYATGGDVKSADDLVLAISIESNAEVITNGEANIYINYNWSATTA